MVFSSISFLFYFLPAFLLCYWLIPAKNATLLVFSLAFYVWGEPRYFPLLLLSIAMNWGMGLLLGRWRAGAKGGVLLVFGILGNLAAIGFYKYANFLFEQLNPLFATLGLSPMPSLEVALPLGISFYTFQAISYLVDIYRRDIKAERNVLTMATYIAMFPHLIAGPIVRYSEIAAELASRRVTLSGVAAGIRVFAFGLAQKVIIANELGLAADSVFALPTEQLSASMAWMGATAYSLQLFFDFSGYSTMAIGLARVIGITFPQNFNYPYIAQSVTDFWRRWHMSLSRWFRDYLYIPLGGNRQGKLRMYLSLTLVFLLCGLWHGAAWTFVLWGLYHGLFLVIERLGLGRVLARQWRPLRHGYALLVCLIGWVFFRADGVSQAVHFLQAMAGFGQSGNHPPIGSVFTPMTWLSLGLGVLFSMPLRSILGSAWPLAKIGRAPLWHVVESGGVVVMIFCSVASVASGSYNPFIYYRF
ncbi:MAG: MBOAT family protein [Gammaproteobacteria bacterium]|nr:MBOAT family protein [Gammaproteobacteria bacterium]